MVSEEQNSDVELASEVIPVPQVQPEAETLEVLNDNNHQANDIANRKPRQRKKVLYNALLKLMEFYFGDSNLTKDRFLSGLVQQNPDVDLDVFLRFNKVRALTTDMSKIVKALRSSTMLKVSDDGTKVRRITPIVEKLNIDECTVYIQRLPSDADHDWLSTLFSEYGPVAYVSIPKFKSSNKIKGFAFVEFETPEAAEKCLKAFRSKGCELSSQTQPTEVLSITTFSEGEKPDENCETNENNTDNTNEDAKQKSEKSKAKKRKKFGKSDEPQDSDHSDCTKPKKKKNDEDTDKDSSVCHSDSNTEESKNKKRKRKAMQEAQDSDTEVPSKEETKKQKPLRAEETDSKKDQDNTESETDSSVNKKKSVEEANKEGTTEKTKRKKRKKIHRSAYQALEATDMGLQAMSKRDWKRLRNKYLDLQRSKMKQLKQHLRRANWNQWGNRVDIEHVEESDNNKKTSSALEFMPGVIVKVELKEACIDPKGFKAELRSNNHVKYVDVKEGSIEAFIRCDSSEGAKELSEKTSNERNLKVLTGDEEKFYWQKITKDREEKIGNKVRVNQRGRDKLLKKAEKELGKHIRFDEV